MVCCTDCADPKQRQVAIKIGKNRKFDVDNAHYEIELLKALNAVDSSEGADNEGHDRIVRYLDSFNFRQHVVMVFELLHSNLYRHISLNKGKKPILEGAHLKRVCYQMV